MTIRALIALAVLSVPAAARADAPPPIPPPVFVTPEVVTPPPPAAVTPPAAVAPAAQPESTAPVAQVSEVAEPARVSKGLFMSLGFAYLPGGIDGPSDAAAVVTQVGWRIRANRIELRFSGALVYEETSYQNSFNGLGVAQFFDYAGDVYSFGAGVGLGVGSFTPMDGKNADNGTSAELLLLATPAALHVGPGHHIELGVDVGVVYLVAFDEVDPFFQFRGGYAF